MLVLMRAPTACYVPTRARARSETQKQQPTVLAEFREPSSEFGGPTFVNSRES